MFFDALGLEYEYEPEGFDLGGGTKYLPDFKVKCPNEDRYIFFEVKRKDGFVPRLKEQSVYLAGKIKSEFHGLDGMASNWRREVAHKDFLGQKYEFYALGPDTDHFSYGYKYAGPNFSDNHGCYIAHERAMSQIENCDFVFAWIDSVDAFGTFHEIGHACGIGKPVYIGFSKNMPYKDMWFMRAAAELDGVFDNPKSAWDGLITSARLRPEKDEVKVAKLSMISPVALVMGDPMEADFCLYQKGAMSWSSRADVSVGHVFAMPVSMIFGAATKARSARFEHGETP